MTSGKPRICFVIPSLAPGGTERQLLYLLEGLRTTHDCAVVCTREAGAWADAARQAGATIHELKTRGGWDIRIAPRIRNVFRTLSPDFVHTFLFGFDLSVNRAARAARVPVVISSRREMAAWMKPRHIRRQRAGNELVDCIVANSDAVATFAAAQEGIDRSRIRVVHNGIDVDALHRSVKPIDSFFPADRRIVGMIANFSPVKDHALFVSVAAELASSRSDVHFVLVGSGGLQEDTKHAVRKAGMESRFTFTSTAHDAASLIARMDVCVCTSQREGFPNAILEAMALRRPVVSAAVGGIPELIENNVSGVLIQTREPRQFANAIGRVLDDDAWARHLAENAFNRVKREFTIETMLEAYRTLYRDLLKKSHGSSADPSCAASAE